MHSPCLCRQSGWGIWLVLLVWLFVGWQLWFQRRHSDHSSTKTKILLAFQTCLLFFSTLRTLQWDIFTIQLEWQIKCRLSRRPVSYLDLGALQRSSSLHNNDVVWKTNGLHPLPLTGWQNAKCKMLAKVMDFYHCLCWGKSLRGTKK